ILLVIDLSFLIVLWFIYRVKFQLKYLPNSERVEKVLFFLGVVATLYYIYSNKDLLVLSKIDFFASDNVSKSLGFIHIPFQFLTAGAILNNPFRTKKVRVFAYAFALIGLAFNVFMGHRLIALIIILWFLFKKFPRIGVFLPVLFFSFFGDISNSIKELIYNFITLPEVDLYYFLSQVQMVFKDLSYSREQSIILMNYILFQSNVDSYANFFELMRVFPFTHTLFEDHIRLTDITGAFYMVREGQGAA